MTAALALVSANRIGQQLGPRGLKTRRRLLDAAARLLHSHSPIDLNAAAITREAGTSPATFYVYFDDVRELMLALVPAAAPDARAMFPHADALLVPSRREADAAAMVAAIFAAWDRNPTILLFRNLEADRGDAAFDASRYAWAQPILDRLITALNAARGNCHGAGNGACAYADAVVLLAAVERVAATSHRAPTYGPPAADLRAALVRMICQALA